MSILAEQIAKSLREHVDGWDAMNQKRAVDGLAVVPDTPHILNARNVLSNYDEFLRSQATAETLPRNAIAELQLYIDEGEKLGTGALRDITKLLIKRGLLRYENTPTGGWVVSATPAAYRLTRSLNR